MALLRSLVTEPQLTKCKSQIDVEYRKLEMARERGGVEAATRLIAVGQRFVPTASSLTIGAVLSDETLQIVLAELDAGSAGAWIRNELGTGLACDLDQAWVRRQYAPRNCPRFHAPHGWHQDGALGFDFLSHQHGTFPSDALLPMVTVWIALDSCGAEAPGLELVTQRLETLLAPGDLTDDRVRARFAAAEFWRPVMQPGDALLFRGDVLHRTHVTPEMMKDRTSIEIRFFEANKIPERLKGDRFINLTDSHALSKLREASWNAR